MQIDVKGHPAFIFTGETSFDSTRPIAIFLHGAGCTHWAWNREATWLAKLGWSVAAIDFAGHDASGGTALTTIEDMRDWTLDLLEELCPREVVTLIGHSMGAAVALEVASEAQARIEGLVLAAATDNFPVNPHLLQQAKDNLPAANDLMITWGHGLRSTLKETGGANPDDFQASLAMLERNAPGVLYADLHACGAWNGAAAAASSVSCPTLLLLSKEDLMTPYESGLAVASQISDARVEEIYNAGHFFIEDASDQVIDALQSFLPLK